jgi:hypothetical protein
MKLKSDSIAKEDVLNRKPFALEIVNQIHEYFKSSKESLIIGIHGSWGSGKSTLLSFIKSEFAQGNPKYILFEFNPWMFSGKEELHKIFLKEFGIAVGSSKQKIRNKIKNVVDALSWAEDFNGISKSATGLAKKFADKSIVSLKAEMDQLLENEGIKSVVFLDDIDRLTPPEMLEIFQLIRLNANFSNTIFIICFDKEVVIRAINEQYGLSGENYLEKIVQVDYSLPEILPEKIESLFFENLADLLTKYQINFNPADLNFAWAYKGLQNFFQNVRDLNRFFNSVQFRLPSFHQNVNIHDFLILESIRIFDHESYVLIKAYYKDSIKFGSESPAQRELSNIGKSRSGSLFALLFENQNRKKNSSQYQVSNTQFFDRYFSLSISSKDVREEDFQYYLNLEESGIDYLGKLIETNRIEFLLRRLSINELYSDSQKERYLKEILTVWSSYANEFTKHHRQVWDVLKAILDSYEDSNKGGHFVIDNLILSEPQFSPARFVYNYYFLQILERNIDSEFQKYRAVIETRKKDLLGAIEHEIRNHMSQFLWGEIYHEFYTRVFLISFAMYLPIVYKDQFVASVKTDQKLIFKLLKIFVLRDTSTGRLFSIDLEFEPYLLPKSLKEEFNIKVNSINTSTLVKKEAEVVEYYREHLKVLEINKNEEKR